MKKIKNQLFIGTIVINKTGWWRNQLNKQLLGEVVGCNSSL